MRPHRVLTSVPALIEMLEVRRVPSGVPVVAIQPPSGIQANENSQSDSPFSTVATDGKGDTVTVWANNGQSGSPAGIYAQIDSANGQVAGKVFRVDTDTTGQDVQPAVAMDALGDFVVVWSNQNQTGTESIVEAREFNLAGRPLSGEFAVESNVTTSQQFPSVAIDAAGDFVVSWSSAVEGGGYGVFAQRFNASDVAQGSEFEVQNSIGAGRITPTVEIDPSGNMTSSHQTYAEDVSLFGVFAQNGVGYYPGAEFQFTNGPPQSSFFMNSPLQDEGNWFWT